MGQSSDAVEALTLEFSPGSAGENTIYEAKFYEVQSTQSRRLGSDVGLAAAGLWKQLRTGQGQSTHSSLLLHLHRDKLETKDLRKKAKCIVQREEKIDITYLYHQGKICILGYGIFLFPPLPVRRGL